MCRYKRGLGIIYILVAGVSLSIIYNLGAGAGLGIIYNIGTREVWVLYII